MEESKTKRFFSVLLGILIVFTFIIPVIPLGAYYIYQNYQVSCVDSSIAHKTTAYDDSTISSDESYTKVAGQNGTRRICTNGNDKEVSNVVVKNPVDQVDINGTKTTVYVAPAPIYTSYGSTCRDGTHSNSVGRGTCSWHGGVAY